MKKLLLGATAFATLALFSGVASATKCRKYPRRNRDFQSDAA